MTSLNIEALEQSFELVKPRAMEFASSFYRNLLTDYPHLRPLFANTNMEEQEQKLIQTLATIILNLRYPETLAGPMRDLGERHARYGTIEEHYPMVADSLLKTFEDYLGEAWTDEVRQAWIDAYKLIVNLMLEGASRAEATFKTNQSPQPIQPPFVTKKDDRFPRSPAVSQSSQRPSQPVPPTSTDKRVLTSPVQQPLEPVAKQPVPAEARDADPSRIQTGGLSQKLSRPITTGEVLLLFSVGAVLLLLLGFFLFRNNTRDNDAQPSAEIIQLIV